MGDGKVKTLKVDGGVVHGNFEGSLPRIHSRQEIASSFLGVDLMESHS
jgi:hypothetical protein